MSVHIQSVGSFFPDRVVTNDELATVLNTSHEWIFSHTGIVSRNIAADDVAASDLGEQAALNAMKNGNVAPEDIDLCLVTTSTPDYIGGLPSTACILQDRLGLRHIPAMDLSAACSGFIYALETARCYIEAGSADTVLIVSTEKYSTALNWEDRSTCVLFGDGAGAAVVTRTEGSNKVSPMFLSADGSKATCLIRPAGGSRQPINAETKEEDKYLNMNGRQVYNYAVNGMIEIIEQTLATHSLSMDDVKYIVPHQANARMIDVVVKRKGWDLNKFFMNIAHNANTASASIPICLNEMVEQEVISRGDVLILVSFGAGFTCGGGLIHW